MTPRHAGASHRATLIGLAILVALAILAFSLFERHGSQDAPPGALVERGMSPGHRMLNEESGRTLPSNTPRIQRADAAITRVSARFGLDQDRVADLALSTRNAIHKQHTEDVVDVLDAALFATEGLPPEAIPPLPPVLAAYAQARLNGAGVPEARAVTRSFVETVANKRTAP
ncbi:hypothetical protein [Lysobacter auxotrophicus]|uniref:Uncharacterized protein n=1 Tax=Lysobacter auxotrophicus TaxID=2992573 RepID=A0ABM8DDQ3_9GAMM|nr:hypothetical protein [Lysobacter auxotrophicus]BDU16727.1 hypothetical protein LA521A_19280 [Lysobacter auxotrophicus]